jgi:hypothetical protein
MSDKRVVILNISKALAGIPLASLAAWGSATSIPWLAALLTIPVAVLIASDTIGSQVAKLRSRKLNEEIELVVPDWWTRDTRSWQNVCMEISDHLPTILHNMLIFMNKEPRVKTIEVVQEIFVNALAIQYLPSAPDPKERRNLGEVVALPILEKWVKH